MTTAYPGALDTTVSTGNLPKIGEAVGQETTIDGAHSALDTALTVASTADFGATGTLVLGGANPERVTYASKTATTFTLDVGLAYDKADLDAVVCVPTAEDWNSIIDAIVAVQTEAGTDPAGTFTDIKTNLANKPFNKLDATIAPGVTNDTDENYVPGSVWVDVTNDTAYVCLDATDGAAVWTEITGSGFQEAVSVYDAGTQSISTGGWATVNWDTEHFDTNGMHDNATNNTRLVAPSAGKYLVVANLVFALNTTGQRLATVAVNGTKTHWVGIDPTQAVNAVSVVVTEIVSLAAAGYVEIQVFQNSGGALNIQGGAGNSAHNSNFGMCKVSD